MEGAHGVGLQSASERLRPTSAPVWLDGNPFSLPEGPTSLPGGGTVLRVGNRYQSTWPSGETLQVFQTLMGGEAFLTLSPEVTRREGAYQGLLGFDYAPGQSTETFTQRDFPRQFPSLLGVAPAQIQDTTQLCQEAGVNEWMIEGCVFDVAATGQPGFVEGAVNAIATTLLDQVQDRIEDEIRCQLLPTAERLAVATPHLGQTHLSYGVSQPLNHVDVLDFIDGSDGSNITSKIP